MPILSRFTCVAFADCMSCPWWSRHYPTSKGKNENLWKTLAYNKCAKRVRHTSLAPRNFGISHCDKVLLSLFFTYVAEFFPRSPSGHFIIPFSPSSRWQTAVSLSYPRIPIFRSFGLGFRHPDSSCFPMCGFRDHLTPSLRARQWGGVGRVGGQRPAVPLPAWTFAAVVRLASVGVLPTQPSSVSRPPGAHRPRTDPPPVEVAAAGASKRPSVCASRPCPARRPLCGSATGLCPSRSSPPFSVRPSAKAGPVGRFAPACVGAVLSPLSPRQPLAGARRSGGSG